MSEYKFMQSVLTRHLIVVTIGGSSGGHFKGVCVTDCRSVYADYKIGDVREDWFTDSFTEITPQEAKDKYGLALYTYSDKAAVLCQISPITDADEMPVVFISSGSTSWIVGERRHLMNYREYTPHQEPPTPEFRVDWSEAPVWADAYGETPMGVGLWVGGDQYQYMSSGVRYQVSHNGVGTLSLDKIKIIEKRPTRTITQILGVSSLSVNSEIAKNQKTVITTPKPTKTQRVINRAFEDIFATTVTFKNPEWGALLFETIEPRLTYEQKLELVCAVYGGDDDEEHY